MISLQCNGAHQCIAMVHQLAHGNILLLVLLSYYHILVLSCFFLTFGMFWCTVYFAGCLVPITAIFDAFVTLQCTLCKIIFSTFWQKFPWHFSVAKLPGEAGQRPVPMSRKSFQNKRVRPKVKKCAQADSFHQNIRHHLAPNTK